MLKQILVDTRSGSEYLFDVEGAECKMTRTDIEGRKWVGMTPIPLVEVLLTAKVDGHLDLRSIGLTSSTIERVLYPIAFADRTYTPIAIPGAGITSRLPMVTDRCACGRVVDLTASEADRDWYPTRVNGNSNYGYEPYCAEESSHIS